MEWILGIGLRALRLDAAKQSQAADTHSGSRRRDHHRSPLGACLHALPIHYRRLERVPSRCQLYMVGLREVPSAEPLQLVGGRDDGNVAAETLHDLALRVFEQRQQRNVRAVLVLFLVFRKGDILHWQFYHQRVSELVVLLVKPKRGCVIGKRSRKRRRLKRVQ